MLLLCLFILDLMLIGRPSASSSFVMATPAVTLSRVIRGSNNHQRIFWNLHEDEEETLVDRKVNEEKVVPARVNHHVRWKSLQHSLRNQDQHPPAIVNSHHRNRVSFILPK
jgi:predicted nucleic acid-binding protein